MRFFKSMPARIKSRFSELVNKDNKEALIDDALNECAKHLYVVFHASQLDNYMMGEYEIEGENYIIEFKRKQL